jgi:hypothetical protein
MKQLFTAIALGVLALPLSAGEPGAWQVEPPGEGSMATYVYTTSHGRFVAGEGSGIAIVYGPRKPRADGVCSFDSCAINVTIDGQLGYEQEWVRFDFSDGTSITARPQISAGQYNVTNDFARANWPIVRPIVSALRKASWVDIQFASGASHRFDLTGSSAALSRGAALADEW